MGKVKRKKNKVQRSNPIAPSASAAANSVEEEVLHDESQDPTSFIDTVIEQLRSHSVEERDSGLNTLSSACSDPGLLNQILKHDIAKTVCSLLEDKSPIVRHSAAGALRNISTTGSAVCSNMISQGIMPHLVKLFKEHYSKDWKPQSHSQLQSQPNPPNTPIGFKIDSIMETYIEAVNLLWNLCESSGQALKVFNEEGLAELLIRCLDVKEYGMRVAIAVGQCLNTVTEDNREAIANVEQFEGSLEKILNSEYDSTPLNDENDWLYLQTLASGILLNLAQQVSNIKPTTITLILRILTKILQVDQNREVSTFSSEIPLRNVNGQSRLDEMETNDTVERTTPATNGDEHGLTVEKVHSLEISRSKISNLLNGQMLALEILTNALYTEEGDENESDIDESDEDGVERMEEDLEDCTVNENITGIIPEVQDAIVQNGLVQTVSDKFFRGPPTNVILILTESPEYGKSILSSIEHLKCRAMLCYQNMVIGLDSNDLLGYEVMKVIWEHFIGRLKFETGNTSADGEVAEACTAAMRALTQKWLDSNEFSGIKVSGDFGSSLEELNVLTGLYNKATVAKIHTNIIKIIGNLGALLANKNEETIKQETELRLEYIGAFLLSRISNYGDSNYLWRVSEALDALFDVFAEDDFNHVMNKLGAMEKLKAYLPLFKKNIRNERRRLGENKAIIETSKDNLARFIDYKIEKGCV